MIKRLPIRELFGYTAASAAALAVDLALMAVLVKVFHVNYMLAAGATFTIGTVALYFISVSHVFKFRRVDNRATEFSMFFGLGLIGLVAHLIGMYVAVDIGHTPILLGKLFAAGFSFCTNFLLRRMFLFAPAQQRQAA